MAMIQKIRNQSSLLIGVIGVAMILFLLGGDFLSSGGGPSGGDINILEIDGEPVSYAEFDARMQKQITRNYGTNPINDQIKESVRKQVWNLLLNEKIMGKEYGELGISVSPDEIFDQVKNNPSPLLAQFFTNPQTGRVYEQLANPAGQIDGDKVLFAIKQMLNDPKGEENWLAIEEALKADRYNTKYNTLLKKGLSATSKEGEADANNKGKRISFKYVVKEFKDVEPGSVEVSDADMKKYYQEHKHEAFYMQRDPTRSIEYIVFNVEPSQQDIEALEQEVDELKEQFIKEKEDTLFVNENADTPFNIRYYAQGSLNKEIDSTVFAADSNQVYGPYTEDGAYKLAKVIGSKISSDSAEARHILIKIEEGDTTAAMALADSLKEVIKAQDNFEDMATEFSDDFGSAQEGGSLGWFTEGAMVKPFNDACFDGKKGDMPIITSQFGIHLIEITDKTEPREKKLVAVLDRKIEPSKGTYDKYYNEASKFSIENGTAEAFRTASADKGLRVADFLRETDKEIAGLEGSREVIRWAFSADIGNISEPFEFGEKFVVAHLKEKREKGVLGLDVESVKERVKLEVTNEISAKKFAEELSQYNNLDDAATSANKSVQIASNVTFSSSSVPGVGTERKLLGAVYNLEKGQLSKPIVDNKGVYLVIVDQIVEAPQSGNSAANQSQLSRNVAARVDYEAFKALQESCEINDNRARFF